MICIGHDKVINDPTLNPSPKIKGLLLAITFFKKSTSRGLFLPLPFFGKGVRGEGVILGKGVRGKGSFWGTESIPNLPFNNRLMCSPVTSYDLQVINAIAETGNI